MGSEEVRLFLSSLANSRHVAINTQKIALNALAFLYNRFLQQPLGDIDYIPESKPRRLPSVISANEVQRILQVMDTRNQVIFALLYGAGLRINECLRLRVKDFDFDNGCITVHDGKGGKSRNSLLPTRLIPVIKQLIEQARLIQQDDNLQGVGPSLPFALDRKYPSAYRQAGRDIRTVQELLGHTDVKTTQIYTHVLGQHFAGTTSPADGLMLLINQ